MRQFMMWYSRGLPGSSNFRRSAGQARDLDELTAVSAAYFDRLEEKAA
jgi:tRNA-dihydrouridine synthase